MLQINREPDSDRKQRAKIADNFMMNLTVPLVQRHCEIMVALDLDFWLMLYSREEFSFRNVYVSMLVGIKKRYIRKSNSRNAD